MNKLSDSILLKLKNGERFNYTGLSGKKVWIKCSFKDLGVEMTFGEQGNDIPIHKNGFLMDGKQLKIFCQLSMM